MEDYKKKYEEALERAKVVNPGTTDYNIVTEIFPEFKESEDEKIRKGILNFLKEFECDHYRNLDFSSWIAWLEKQGEQKPAWSKDDENGFSDALYAIQQARTIAKNENDMGNLWYAENWLKSLKERMKGE